MLYSFTFFSFFLSFRIGSAFVYLQTYEMHNEIQTIAKEMRDRKADRNIEVIKTKHVAGCTTKRKNEKKRNDIQLACIWGEIIELL